ncbi:ABC transporter permease [Actinocrispum sp. NPDC049592]|uniref:ABC transporter permease n=1 Tax=Actinocrispum sp. NPDC049592 TaxID=3154835 RepID=UPI00341CD35A
MHNIRAELAKQVHRPASWLLLAIAVVQTITFAYIIPYAGSGGPVSRGLDAMLPSGFVSSSIAGLPLFIGALALIFGVLVAGSEYGWETWKTVLAQRPSRLSVYGAKLVTVAVGTFVMVLALMAFSAATSAVIAGIEGRPMAWPGVLDILQGFGAGWLVSTMWGALGVLLAILLRGVALPIGLGLVWMLAIQNLLSAIAAPMLDFIAQLQKGLPGPNAGSLVAAITGPNQAPGVDALVSGGPAALVVTAYLIAFAGIGGWLLRRRDII